MNENPVISPCIFGHSKKVTTHPRSTLQAIPLPNCEGFPFTACWGRLRGVFQRCVETTLESLFAGETIHITPFFPERGPISGTSSGFPPPPLPCKAGQHLHRDHFGSIKCAPCRMGKFAEVPRGAKNSPQTCTNWSPRKKFPLNTNECPPFKRGYFSREYIGTNH